MPAELYDLFWVYPTPQVENPEIPVQQARGGGEGAAVDVQPSGIPAMILYPALCTPEIVMVKSSEPQGDYFIELLMLFKADTLEGDKDSDPVKNKIRECVNKQLKITGGLDPQKKYDPGPVITDNLGQNIHVGYLGTLKSKEIYQTSKDLNSDPQNKVKGHFLGLVDERAREFYNDKKFTEVYWVSVRVSELTAMFALADETEPKNPKRSVAQIQPANKRPDFKYQPEASWILPGADQEDDQDYLIYHEFRNKAAEMNQGQYGFRVRQGSIPSRPNDDDVAVGELDTDNPVQAYHPVFLYEVDDFRPLNIGHISDIHINSRQQILANSTQKIINHDDFRPLGQMVNIASHNTKLILDRFAQDPEVDVVLITGDIIDFIRNAWCENMAAGKSAEEVREILSLEHRKTGRNILLQKRKPESTYLTYYKDNVDLLAVYSLIVDFYKNNPNNAKPVFMVSGNHDPYLEPVGMFPTLAGSKPKPGRKKTDAFIPASHNLTMYEAALCFGKSYDRIVKRNLLNTPETAFGAGNFKWFYVVFTPFRDFAAQLPLQSLMGMGWGDREDMITLVPGRSKQGRGHLPLSKDQISNQLVSLLDKLKELDNQRQRKKILFSHFTFVSYHNMIPESLAEQGEGEVHYSGGYQRQFTEYDMGTFHVNRVRLYRQELAERKIQCLLSGHTHRRAIYAITGHEKSTKLRPGKSGTVSTKYYKVPEDVPVGRLSCMAAAHPTPAPVRGELLELDWNEIRTDARQTAGNIPDDPPWIIVSDASGSITRRNQRNEFGEFGNGRCSGLKVVFNDDTTVKKVVALPIGFGPRFAVAIDYFAAYGKTDVYDNKDLRLCFAASFAEASEVTLLQYDFELTNPKILNEFRDKFGVEVESIALYKNWHYFPTERVLLTPTQEHGKVVYRVTDTAGLRSLQYGIGRRLFMAIKFRHTPYGEHYEATQDYDFSTPWVSEVKVTRKCKNRQVTYSVERQYYWSMQPKFAEYYIKH